MVGREALVDVKLFVDQPRAQGLADLLVEMGPVQQWSWAFKIVDSDQVRMGGRMVRVLKAVDVYEVSPVYRAASIGTRTTSAKDDTLTAAQRAELDRIAAHWALDADEELTRLYLQFVAACL